MLNDLRIKNRNVLYYVLSILVIMAHNDGYFFYVKHNIEINNSVILIIDYFTKYLFQIAVPIFLFFSGMFFYKNTNNISELIKKIKSRLITIVMPYFAWNIISIIWNYVISVIPFLKKNAEVREIFTFSMQNIFDGIFYYKYNKHFWFMYSMCIFIIISPILYFLFKNKKIGTIVVISIIALYFFGYKMPVERHTDSFIYYLIGCYIGKYYYKEFATYINSMNFKKIIIFGFVFILSEISLYFISSKEIITVINAIAGLSFSLVVLNINYKNPNLEVYDYYFMNFCMHFIVQPCVCKLIWLFLPHNSFFALFYLFGGVTITVLIIYFISSLIRKYFNGLWFILTGQKQ